jgi:hypothetical protein
MSEKTLKAFCWRTGLIQLAPVVPEGALELATAPATLLAQTIDGIGRLSYDNHHFLVPGVPEAPDDNTAMDAVFDFQSQLNKRLSIALASHNGGGNVSAAPRV